MTTGQEKRPVGAPADQRQLVADLHEGGPDVVEELDLDHRLEAARRHADGAPDDVGLGQRGVEDATGAVPALQVVGDLEDAALALDLVQAVLPGAVRHVLAEDDDARIAGHLVVEARVEQVHHRLRGPALGGLGRESRPTRDRRSREYTWRVALSALGAGRAEGRLGGDRDLPVDLVSRSASSSSSVARPSVISCAGNAAEGIAPGVGFALGRGR